MPDQNKPQPNLQAGEKHLLLLLSVVNRGIQRRLEKSLRAELDENLSITHADILAYLSINKRATVSELTEFLGVTKSTMTALLKKLEDLDYVMRESDAHDKRQSWILPTRHLQSKMIKARRIGETESRQILAPLSAQERAQLSDLLGRIRDAL